MARRTPQLHFKAALAHRVPFIAMTALAWSILVGLSATTSAETLGSCKVCRDYHRACLQAHSKQACKSELDVCLKHCERKK